MARRWRAIVFSHPRSSAADASAPRSDACSGLPARITIAGCRAGVPMRAGARPPAHGVCRAYGVVIDSGNCQMPNVPDVD
jgi:hypothetical protein